MLACGPAFGAARCATVGSPGLIFARSLRADLPGGASIEETLARQPLDRVGGLNAMLAGVEAVVALDFPETIDVVCSQARGALQTGGRDVAEPVDLFQPRSIA